MRPDVQGVDAAVPELDREDDFLDVFKRLGCYLEDLSPVPVNHLDASSGANAARSAPKASSHSRVE
jgi:hypothetical protein